LRADADNGDGPWGSFCAAFEMRCVDAMPVSNGGSTTRVTSMILLRANGAIDLLHGYTLICRLGPQNLPRPTRFIPPDAASWRIDQERGFARHCSTGCTQCNLLRFQALDKTIRVCVPQWR